MSSDKKLEELTILQIPLIPIQSDMSNPWGSTSYSPQDSKDLLLTSSTHVHRLKVSLCFDR